VSGKKTPWIFVDCEARGTSPVNGTLTEFSAVHYDCAVRDRAAEGRDGLRSPCDDSGETFHGRPFEATPDPANPAVSIVGARLATDLEVAAKLVAWLREHLGTSRAVPGSPAP
jgi:hypothetical protein